MSPLLRMVVIVVALTAAGGGGVGISPSQWISTNHDLLSALTHSTLDLDYLNQPDLLTSLHDLTLTSLGRLHHSDVNLTIPDAVTSPNISMTSPRPRKRRYSIAFQTPGYIELELKLLVPLMRVYASDNINLEIPFAYEMEIPEKPKGAAKEEKEESVEHFEEAVGAMPTTLRVSYLLTSNCICGQVNIVEEVSGIDRMGVDGGGCVRKALCELAATPSLSPEGLAGEIVNLVVKHLSNQSLNLTTNEETEENLEEMKENESGSKKQEEKNLDEEFDSEAGRENGEEAESDEKRKKERRWKRTKRDYASASYHGKTGGDCWEAFPECPVSLHQLMLRT
nr:uncharacterized protein LOC128692485 [Cherax quadricarinatus]